MPCATACEDLKLTCYSYRWCPTIDQNNLDQLVDIWENKNVSMVLDSYTRGQENGWLQSMIEKALPLSGNFNIGSCGIPKADSCDI